MLLIFVCQLLSSGSAYNDGVISGSGDNDLFELLSCVACCYWSLLILLSHTAPTPHPCNPSLSKRCFAYVYADHGHTICTMPAPCTEKMPFTAV